MEPQDIEWAVTTITKNAPRYKLYQDYYDGNHELLFADKKFDRAFGNVFKAFADNLCPTIVDSLTDRLRVASLTSEIDEQAQLANDLWKKARLRGIIGQAIGEAAKSGDSYLIVWEHPDQPRVPVFWPQDPNNMAIRYNEETSEKEIAAKFWCENPGAKQADKIWRLTLYYADRVERYKAIGGDAGKLKKAERWELVIDEDGELGVVENPFGVVPVFHFANNARVGQMGRSELVDVIPLQNGLNKTIADMLVAMEFAAIPQRWATGIETPQKIDPDTGMPTGEPAGPSPFKPGPDRVWTVADYQANFGQFSPAELGQFTETADSFRVEMARVSRRPLRYIVQGGGAESGEAKKTDEAQLVAICDDRADSFGNVISDVFALALKITGQAEAQIEVEWEPFATRDEINEMNVLLLKQQIAVPNSQLQEEAGYTPDQIAEFNGQVEVQQDAMTQAALAAMDRGAPVTTGQGEMMV